MSATTSCDCCCTPVVSLVPGTAGDDGADGAVGSNAYTLTTSVSTPATFNKGATLILVNVVDAAWAVIGQVVAIAGAGTTDGVDTGIDSAGYFLVTNKTATSLTLTYLDTPANENGQGIASGVLVAPAGATVSIGALPAAITDSSTGTAAAAIAAGAGMTTLVVPVTLAVGGTGAGVVLNEYALGYKFKIYSWAYVTAVAGATGAARVFNMEIGAVDVGTVVSTITLEAATTTPVGAVVAGTAVAGANTGAAADTFSIEVANGGTAFTAGSGFFVVEIQNMDTADALASLAVKVNDLITALTP